jgi:hypothetical protein
MTATAGGGLSDSGPRMLRPRKGHRAQRYRPCTAKDSRLALELRRTLPPALRRMLR